MLQRIAAGDRKLMERLNHWPAPLWIRAWMVGASRAGDGWLWIPLGLLILAFGGDKRIPAMEAGLFAVFSGVALFNVLKRIFNRPRPSSADGHVWATLLPPDRFSFPSGHTIAAFTVAIPIGLSYPALLPGLLFCALSVAASRVLLGLHYLSDVIAGTAIGVLIGLASFWWLGPAL